MGAKNDGLVCISMVRNGTGFQDKTFKNSMLFIHLVQHETI
jgi:hypothetical protein